MASHSYQRFFAYFLDFFIVVVISTFLTIWIPNSEKYESAYKEEMTVVSDYIDGKIEDKEFESITKDLTYTLNRERVIYSLVDLIITVAYFGSFTYYSDGQTLGKKVMKIKIVSNDNKEASHFNLLIRAFLINGCLASFLELVFVLLMQKELYFSTLTCIEFVQLLFLISSLFMIIYRKDKRGLHDLICDTKVIKVD